MVHHNRYLQKKWKNPFNLFFVRLPCEERLQVDKFSHDAAYAPDVDRGAVLFGPKKDIRWPVPQGHHLVGERSDRNPKGSGQSKVAKFDDPFLEIVKWGWEIELLQREECSGA